MAIHDNKTTKRFSDIIPFNNPYDNKDTKKSNEFWLNVGIMEEIINEEGIVSNEFISLPLGIPLDNLSVSLKQSNSESYNQIQLIRKDLLDYIKEVCSTLEEGEHGFPEGLIIQIRRNKPQEELPKNQAITTSVRSKLGFKKA